MPSPSRAVLALSLAAFAAAAAPNPKLEEARKLVDDLELEKAVKVLAAAEAVQGNSRAQLLEILELQGVAYGTLGKEAKARDAFRTLLLLEPSFKLPGEHPPRVRTPFFEAREWASENALSVVPSAVVEGAKVTALTVTVKKDLMRLVRRVRFVVKTGAGVQRSDAQVDTSGVARLAVDAPRVSWWAIALSERDAELLSLGSEAAPLEHAGSGAPAQVSTAPEKTGAPVEAEEEAPPPRRWMRTPGFALLGGGVVAGGVGVLLGVLSGQARAQVLNATTNDAGLVTGLTQREATALEARSRTFATVANVLFVAGGVLAATGVTFVVLGSTGEPVSVTLSATPGGLLARGTF